MQTYNIISRAKEKGLTGSLLFVYIVQDLKFIFHCYYIFMINNSTGNLGKTRYVFSRFFETSHKIIFNIHS